MGFNFIASCRKSDEGSDTDLMLDFCLSQVVLEILGMLNPDLASNQGYLCSLIFKP